MHLLFIIKEIDNEPHGILRVSAALKQSGHRTDMVVATEEDPVEAALRLKPDVVAYSVYTGTQRYYLDVNRRIRAQMGVFSIMGGPHPTFFPEIIEEEGVDGICIGEGEHATVDLVNALENGDPIETVSNWWIKSNGHIHRNPLRPLVTDLDQLLFPDRELLYRAHPLSRERKLKPFITGRGCPYNCSFCFNEAYSDLYKGKGRRTRRRSVDNVILELKEVRERYPLDFVLFLDDTFIINKKWLQELAVRYKEEIGLPFRCFTHPLLAINNGYVRVIERCNHFFQPILAGRVNVSTCYDNKLPLGFGTAHVKCAAKGEILSLNGNYFYRIPGSDRKRGIG